MAAARHRAAVTAARLGLLAVVLGAWELAGRASGGLLFPPFSAALSSWLDQAAGGQTWTAVLRSNQALVIGFPTSALLGVPLGLVLGRQRWLDSATGHYLDLMLVIPMVAVVPIVIGALGLTLTARAIIVVLFALPVIAMNARAGVRVIDHQRVEMARSFGASARQVWAKVILPAAVGPMYAGLRLGLARSVSGMVVVELVLIPVGLGGLIVNYQSQFAAADLYAATLTIVAEGVLLGAAARASERWVSRRISGAA